MLFSEKINHMIDQFRKDPIIANVQLEETSDWINRQIDNEPAIALLLTVSNYISPNTADIRLVFTKKTIAEQAKPASTKFVVKQPKVKKPKAVMVEDDSSSDESIEKQIDRNEALLRKIQQMQKASFSEKVAPPPALKRQKRFSLFY